MDAGFFSYLQQLEAMAFFSGYPLLFALVVFIAGNKKLSEETEKYLIGNLPYTYAFVGVLFWGLQLKNLFPDYSIEHINQLIHRPFLVLWGMGSVLFGIPVFSKISILPLLHSSVFFFFLLKDVFLQSISFSVDKNIVRNDMKIYTDSLLLNLGVYVLVTLTIFLISSKKRKSHFKS